jgi:hypothetical protein
MKANLQSILGLASYFIRNKKPTVSDTIPTVGDLRANLNTSEEMHGEGTPAIEENPVIASEKATAAATGCVPCSIGHLGTCSGLLNEAMRFARKDGVQSEEVIGRVNMCLDELNALERVDLRPELIHGLPDWEKTLAEKALSLSRSLRHDLEGLSTLESLEGIAAKTQGTRQEIGKSWFKERISRMSPEQREHVEQELEKIANEPT